MTSHQIQKDLAKSCAEATSKRDKKEIRDNLSFVLLLMKSHDISIVKQML